jgi:hypothetical protein
MSRKFRFKALVLTVLFIIPLIFGATSNVFAQDPPSGAKITGKAISAVLTAVVIRINNFPVVVQVIVGICNNIPFAIGPDVNDPIDPDTIPTIIQEQVEGIFLPDAGPAGCYSEFGGDDLVITRVSNFSNTGEAMGADISLQLVQ